MPAGGLGLPASFPSSVPAGLEKQVLAAFQTGCSALPPVPWEPPSLTLLTQVLGRDLGCKSYTEERREVGHSLCAHSPLTSH